MIYTVELSGKKRPCVTKACEECGTGFPVWIWILKNRPKHGRFCGKSCRMKWQQRVRPTGPRYGSDNPNFRHGLMCRAAAKRMSHVAHQKLNHAVRTGKLQRGPCERCGSTSKTEGHHDDYRRPLAVRWLCKPCHVIIDKQLRQRAGTMRRLPFTPEVFSKPTLLERIAKAAKSQTVFSTKSITAVLGPSAAKMAIHWLWRERKAGHIKQLTKWREGYRGAPSTYCWP